MPEISQIGKYAVKAQLGAGGFGAVYLCEDRLGQQVAIKLFQPRDEALAGLATSASQDAGEVLRRRFLDEAKTLRQLSSNPYIVELYDFDELEDGTPYYVMPYLSHSLVEEIGKDAFTPGARQDLNPEDYPRRLPLPRALEVLQQLLTALKDVHQAGLIHRDIKPANILFDRAGGKVQLCDFGIAKVPDAEHSQTSSGLAMGSRNYMSPEQRESAKHVTASSDVYSLGVLAYRMLTGVLPVGRFDDPIAHVPALSPALNTLILACLEQDASQRPQSAVTLNTQLREAIAQQQSVEEGSDTGHSGTWVESGKGEARLKAQLSPLEQRLEALLLAHAQIPPEHDAELQALAAVGGLDEAGLAALVDTTEARLHGQLAARKNFLTYLGKQNAAALANTRQRAALQAAGESAGFDAQRVAELIKQQGATLAATTPRSGGRAIKAVALLLTLAGAVGLGLYLMPGPEPASEPAATLELSDKATQPPPPPVTTNPTESEGNKVGPATAPNPAPAPQAMPKPKVDAESIRQAQAYLQELGYPVVPDGKLGARTLAVIQQYEKQHKLIQTGEVDATLLAHLKQQFDAKQAEAQRQLELAEAARQKAAAAKAEAEQRARQAAAAKAAKEKAEREAAQQQKLLLAKLQSELKRLDYPVNDAEGELGESTRRALEHFTILSKGEYAPAISTRLLTELKAAKRQPGPETKQDCKACPVMVKIPAGSFQMGSEDSSSKQKPVHAVTVGKPFWMSQFEITWQQWEACVADSSWASGCSKKVGDAGFGRGSRPVVNVNWDDAQDYAKWLSKKTGKRYRLPTEAEWEYAARGGTSTKYSWGNGIDCSKARYGYTDCNSKSTVEVGRYSPNAYGLYDMHGNVWEWVEDCWNSNYNGAPGDGSAWKSGDCGRRVLRGGSWDGTPWGLRSATRFRLGRATRNYTFGFRLVQD